MAIEDVSIDGHNLLTYGLSPSQPDFHSGVGLVTFGFLFRLGNPWVPCFEPVTSTWTACCSAVTTTWAACHAPVVTTWTDI